LPRALWPGYVTSLPTARPGRYAEAVINGPMNRKLALLGLLFVFVVLSMTACSHAPVTSPSVPPPVTPPAGPSGPVSAVPLPTPPSGKTQGVIYLPSGKGGDDDQLVAQTVPLHSTQSPALDSLNALAKAPDSPLPSGTQIRGIKLADGLATVDLSREFQTNFHGGTTEESQTVNSILETLGQFPNIDRVQILVEGKSIDALSQLPLDGPLDVIHPATARQASGGG
jgi:germination protein M